MKLSIVIVHYNTSDDLARCLASLRENPPACEHRVVVVDNASTDPGLPAVREGFPEVEWLFQSRNVGYAAGVNAGLALHDAEYSLVLNPDIVVLPGAIDALLADADAHPRAGIIGPQLLNPDGSVQESCRRFYTLSTLLLRRTFLGRLFPRARAIQRHLMRDFDHRSPRAVDWVLGGCMLVRREALRRVGPMDERFFLYFEDVDWCYRMWQGGYEVRYTPAARFVHRHRRASAGGITRRGFWLHLASLVSFYEKWGMLVYALKRWSGPLGTLLAWLVDMAAINVAFAGSWLLRRLLQPWFTDPLFPWREYHGLQLYATLLATVTFAMRGRYGGQRGRDGPGIRRDLGDAATVALLLLASTYLSHQVLYSRAVLLFFFPLSFVCLVAGGAVWRRVRRRMARGHLSLERTLLADPGPDTAAWLAGLGDPREAGLDLVGWTGGGGDGLPDSLPRLGEMDDLVDLVARYRIGQVVFGGWPDGRSETLRRLAVLRRQRVRLRWLAPEAALVVAGGRGEVLGGRPGVVLDPGMESVPMALARRLAQWGTALMLTPAVVAGGVANRLARGDAVTTVVLPDGTPLRIHRDSRGRPRPLWRQPGLWAALWRGHVAPVAARPLSGPETGTGEGDGAVATWDLDPSPPGLTGPWAGATPGERWRRFWRDPGGLSALFPVDPETGSDS